MKLRPKGSVTQRFYSHTGVSHRKIHKCLAYVIQQTCPVAIFIFTCIFFLWKHTPTEHIIYALFADISSPWNVVKCRETDNLNIYFTTCTWDADNAESQRDDFRYRDWFDSVWWTTKEMGNIFDFLLILTETERRVVYNIYYIIIKYNCTSNRGAYVGVWRAANIVVWQKRNLSNTHNSLLHLHCSGW